MKKFGDGEKLVLERAYEGNLGVCSNLLFDMFGYINNFCDYSLSYTYHNMLKLLLTQVSDSNFVSTMHWAMTRMININIAMLLLEPEAMDYLFLFLFISLYYSFASFKKQQDPTFSYTKKKNSMIFQIKKQLLQASED